MLNSVVKISMVSAKYFEYYTIILRGPFFRGHTVYFVVISPGYGDPVSKMRTYYFHPVVSSFFPRLISAVAD